jgi:hypothetical protein
MLFSILILQNEGDDLRFLLGQAACGESIRLGPGNLNGCRQKAKPGHFAVITSIRNRAEKLNYPIISNRC